MNNNKIIFISVFLVIILVFSAVYQFTSDSSGEVELVKESPLLNSEPVDHSDKPISPLQSDSPSVQSAQGTSPELTTTDVSSETASRISSVESSKGPPKEVASENISKLDFSPVDTEANSDNPSDALYLAVIILSIGFTISICITFYLYKWRKIILSSPSAVVPEEWAKYLQGVGKDFDTFTESIGGHLQNIVNASDDQSSKISNMIDTYMELQTALDEKDKELSRYKDGYDSEIFKKFIVRFARVEQALDNFIDDKGPSDEYLLLKRLFEDAFEECGVSRKSPSIGDDYRTAKGVSDHPKTEISDDPELDFKISEVIESGYELVTGDGSRTIIPSKVRIYKFVKEEVEV